MPQSQVANVAVMDFGAGNGPATGTAATATVTLSTVVDGNTVTLSDGVLTKIFEFDSNSAVTGSNILVAIGGSDTAAALALSVAIIASGLSMTATAALGVTTVKAITVEGSETLGNAYTIAKVGSPVTVAAFAGGVNEDLTCSVVRLRTKNDQGGKLSIKFENPNGDNDLVVSLQVATTPSSVTPAPAGGWAATTAGNNLAAVTTVTIPRRASKAVTILLRRGVDNYVRLLATGRCRGQAQIRGDVIVEPVKI